MTTVPNYCASEETSDSLSLQQIAEMTGGRLSSLTGSPNPNEAIELVCTSAAPPLEANHGVLTMVDDAKHISAIQGCTATAVLTPSELQASEINGDGPEWQIIVDDVHAAFAKIILHFRPSMNEDVPGTGVHSTAQIHPSTQLSSAASVGAHVTIGPGCRIHAGVSIAAGCQIGAHCVLHPGVTLYSYTQLADRVVLHAGTVIGAHGFGYKQVDGRHVPTSQLGYVRIENDVEVGASVTIDRGTYGATLIGEGTKIDNQVMIAHNCRIGKHNLLCSQVGIAGSCTTGDYVVLAGQVGLKDHIHLDDGVIVAAQAGVMDNLTSGVYLGSPARPQREQMQIYAVQRRLPELRRDVKNLQKQIDALTNRLSPDQTSSIKAA